MEKRDFAGLELGPPDISIRNVEARTYIVVVLFLGGGGWVAGCYASVRHTRPPRQDYALVPYGTCLCVNDMWAQQVAGPHVSHPRAVAFKAPKQRPPRHKPGLPGAPTLENANGSSFICKRICMYYHAPVFLAIISHSKRDTPSVHFCKSFQTT